MIDFNSPAWHGLRKWAEAELKRAREKNDSVECDDVKTAALRGEIRLLKKFLALPEQAARGVAIEPSDD